MVFQNIDGEFHLFTKNLESVNLLSDDINQHLSSLINLTSDWTKQGQMSEKNFAFLMEDVDRLSAEIGHDNALSDMFEQAAKSGKHAQLSIEDCYSAILNGNTKGFKNVSNVIKTFNSLDPNQQKAWATATGQSNQQLGKYLSTVKDGKASLIGYGASLVGATAKTVMLEVATTALNAAISMGLSIAFQAFITLVTNTVNALDNAIDKVKDAKDALKTSDENINSINKELKTTKERLDDLQKIETPTLFEQDEIDKLVKYNDELERKLDLEKRNREKAQKEARDESINAWNTIIGGTDTLTSGQNTAFAINYAQGKTVKQNQDALEEYIRLLNQINETEKLYQENGWEETENSRLAVMRKQAEALKEQILNFIDNIEIIRDGLDPTREKDKEIIATIDAFINKYSELNKVVDGTFTEIWENGKYASATKELENLAKQGELTAESFNNVKGIEEFKEALEAIGITKIDDVVEAIIKMVNDTKDNHLPEDIEETAEEIESLSDSIKRWETSVDLITKAQKEMNEQGYISASTYASLIEQGGNFTQCLEVVNGKLVLNVEKLKNLEKQQLHNLIIDNNIRIGKLNESLAHGANANAVREETKAIQEQNAVYETMLSELDNAGNDDTTKKEDTSDTDKQYNKQLDKLKKASDGTQKAEEELIQNWINLNDTFYATSDPDKWAENYDTIGDYTQKFYKDLLDKGILNVDQYKDKINAFFEKMKAKGVDLGKSWLANALSSVSVDDAMSSWDLEYGFDSDKSKDDFELRQERIDEFRKQIVKAYGVDGVNNVKAYTDAMKEADEQQQKLNEDTYAKTKEDLSADGDRLLDDVLADVDKLSKMNIDFFSDDEDTLKENAKDIFETVSKSAQDALERELITPERYKEIIDKYSKGLNTGTIQDAYDDAFDKIADSGKDKLDKMLITPDEYFKLLDEWGKKLNISKDVIDKLKEAVSESDYLDRWDLDNSYDENKSKDDYELRAKRIEYIYKLAKQLYGKNGQKNLKAYNALINQGLEDVESLVEDYYDAEIKKLEEINDKEKERQKALELQLNLIKARQKLEEAKNNRNQLIFHNGTFEYVSNQDDVLSAQEDVAESQKAILEQEREDQIKALEDQKAKTLKFFNSVGGKLDDFIDRVKKFLSGDKDAFKIDESKAKTGSDTKSDNESNTNSDITTTNLKDRTLTATTDKTEINADNVEVKTDTGTSAVADITDTATTEEPVVSINDLVSNIDANVTGISETATAISDATKGIFDVTKAFANGFNFENLVRALGGNPTAEAVKNFQDSYNATLVGKHIVPSTLPSNIINNSSTTNNSAKTINVGDIHLHFDLTLNSLDEFVDGKIDEALLEVGRYVKQKLPAILAKA